MIFIRSFFPSVLADHRMVLGWSGEVFSSPVANTPSSCPPPHRATPHHHEEHSPLHHPHPRPPLHLPGPPPGLGRGDRGASGQGKGKLQIAKADPPFQSRPKRFIFGAVANLLRIQLFPTPILPFNFILINVQFAPKLRKGK